MWETILLAITIRHSVQVIIRWRPMQLESMRVGQPDGQNPQLTTSPKTVVGNCNDYPPSDVLSWCNAVPSYWVNRQTDTKRLLNKDIIIGINNSYGGSITQLSSSDRSQNLIDEHGGALIQLSLYGLNTTTPPYNSLPPNNLVCHESDRVIRDSLIPFRHKGSVVARQAANGTNELSNDVDISSSVTNGWYTRFERPQQLHTRGYKL